CQSNGESLCIAGTIEDNCIAGTPGSDDASCNGLDDDCDGAVDEDFPTVDTDCGVGACSA
ncbi:MAG: hypothetical protein GWO04_00780, partial [Actinobacteria bacterium]|nr:hypothetical protein [Actinomycetota bacterium]NIT94016.1 hypothetical protein [Actinomycetota bacterium]NIV54151.1 hypothetical protein [Actinomycetota bacterium]NIV85441.1 hypothetical protein [Actinomycetota bacterium]NIX49001.1 hypothetical protein [Actinomycetota bacterium]